MWGWGALKEIETRVAFRKLWEIKSPSLFIDLRRPWELTTLPGVGIVEFTVLKAVDQVCGRPELNYALSLPNQGERRLREMDDCRLKGDGHRYMQAKCKRIREGGFSLGWGLQGHFLVYMVGLLH